MAIVRAALVQATWTDQTLSADQFACTFNMTAWTRLWRPTEA